MKIMGYLTLAVLVILVICIVYYYFPQKEYFGNNPPSPTDNQATKSNGPIFPTLVPKHSIALLFKTHHWTDDIEKFAKKLQKETNNKVDYYILMHSDNYQLINKVKDPSLKKHIAVFSQNDIIKTYQKGFYSMWLSNHWILMWFYRKLGGRQSFPYQYVWTMEYDVRISGNSSQIWTYAGDEDFIYPIPVFQDPNWRYKDHYVGGKLTDKDKYYGYLQLARYSRKFLAYLDKCYESGENGQDELITFSLFKRGKFKGSHQLLNNLIKDSWSVSSEDSEKHKKLYFNAETEYHKNDKHLRIFHPIK